MRSLIILTLVLSAACAKETTQPPASEKKQAIDCKDTEQCQTQGLCSLSNGTCQAMTDTDCQHTTVCKDGFRCTAHDGKCVLDLGVTLPNVLPNNPAPSNARLIVAGPKGVFLDHKKVADVDCTHNNVPCTKNAPAPTNASYRVNPTFKENADPKSFLITPLKKGLEKIKGHKATLVIDAQMTYNTVAELMYSAGMAQYSDMAFVVAKGQSVGTLHSSLPQIGRPFPKTGIRPDKPPFKMTMLVAEKGLTIRLNEGSQTRLINALKKDNAPNPTLPKAQEIPPVRVADAFCQTAKEQAKNGAFKNMEGQCMAHNVAALYTTVTQLKAQHSPRLDPRDPVTVTAEITTPWGQVASVVSAIQCQRENKRYTSFVAFNNAKVKGSNKGCTGLFPSIVFALSD